MITCDKCKYYKIDSYDCSNPKIIDTSKYWDYEDMPQDSVSFSDSENYKAYFKPMPKFGCILGEYNKKMRVYRISMLEKIQKVKLDYILNNKFPPNNIELSKLEYEELQRDLMLPNLTVELKTVEEITNGEEQQILGMKITIKEVK